jgi:hypothetical protein
LLRAASSVPVFSDVNNIFSTNLLWFNCILASPPCQPGASEAMPREFTTLVLLLCLASTKPSYTFQTSRRDDGDGRRHAHLGFSWPPYLDCHWPSIRGIRLANHCGRFCHHLSLIPGVEMPVDAIPTAAVHLH